MNKQATAFPRLTAQVLVHELWVLHGKPDPLHDGNWCYTCNVLALAVNEGVTLSAANASRHESSER